MASNIHPIILVAIGDMNVGKTELLLTFEQGEYLEKPEKTIPRYDTPYHWKIDVDGTDRNIVVWDTLGCVDYDQIRTIFYRQADCFLICYEISNRESFENITSQWIPKIQPFIKKKKIPLILVGMKSDHREDGFVSADEGVQLKETIEANAFIECSAKNDENIIDIFKAGVRAVGYKRERKKWCVLQ